MPGPNCAFPGCTVSYTQKHNFITCFKIPTRTVEYYVNWKNNILQVLNKYREVDKDLRDRINGGKVFICERHYKPDDIEYTSELLSY